MRSEVSMAVIFSTCFRSSPFCRHPCRWGNNLMDISTRKQSCRSPYPAFYFARSRSKCSREIRIRIWLLTIKETCLKYLKGPSHRITFALKLYQWTRLTEYIWRWIFTFKKIILEFLKAFKVLMQPTLSWLPILLFIRWQLVLTLAALQ
jgi:hypothetical protein